MPQSFNVCSIHNCVEVFSGIWVKDSVRMYESSYAVQEKACPICEHQVYASFTQLWEQKYEASSRSHLQPAQSSHTFGPLDNRRVS
jgi:hypothetical protein